MDVSVRVKEIPYSATRVLTPYAEQAKKDGKKIYHLNLGAPDTNVPDEFFDAIANIKNRNLPYAPSKGIESLRTEISKYYQEKNIDIEPDEVVITNGASEALIFAFTTVTDQGDNILTSNPFYTNYNTGFKQCAIQARTFDTFVDNGYRLPSYEKIVENIDDRTKAILLSNPSNPTGVVYTEEEVRLIAKVAIEHDLYIIADEVYREFAFDNHKFFSFGEIKEIQDRLILVDSISKRFGACGARIGAVSTKNKDLYSQFVKLATARLAVSTVDQVGAAALYEVNDEYFEDVNKLFQKRRDVIIKELEKIDGIKVYKPEGAFYVMPELPVDDVEKFAIWLLTDFSINNETVMIAPGSGFYSDNDTGKKQARIAYVLNVNEIPKAINILKIALEEYNKKN
jgi:aspartate aminotransferase